MNMNKTTDTNQASELFELCKKVYELFPFWAGTDMIYGKEQDGGWKIMPLTLSIPKRNRVPLYTSDYLLEKLPETYNKQELMLWRSGANSWRAGYSPIESYRDDTPLKAILKLTIALSEAGELNE